MEENKITTLNLKIFKVLFVILILTVSLFCLCAKAATINLQTLSTQVSSGQTVTVNVSLNSQDAAINNAEAVISFPADLVQVSSISQTGSIFSIWVQPPTYSNSDGTITFNGGLPNPGFTGNYGKIISVQFKAKAAGTAGFDFSSAAVRANDGLGTNVLNGQSGASLIITGQNTNPAPTPQPVSSTFSINSKTHPDSTKWYNLNQAVFNLTYPAGSVAAQTSLDSTEGTTPRILRKSPLSTITVDNLKDGVWYFNARYQTSSGWSKTYAYKIQVDTTAPEGLTIKPGDSNTADGLPTLSAKDNLSGMDYYMVAVDGGNPIKILYSGDQTPINLPGLTTGTHQLVVQAFDLAGNSTSVETAIDFKSQTQVSITEYTKNIIEGQNIQAIGFALQNSTVSIELQNQEHLIRTYSVNTDSQGNFHFNSEPIAGSGRYLIRAELFNKDGSLKATSKQLPIEVTMSTISKLSHFISNLSKLITPYNITILLLSLLCLIGWMNYLALRHELYKLEKQIKDSKKPFK